MIANVLVRLFGHMATIMFSDPASFDRWLWLRRYIKSGSLRTLDAGCGSGALSIYAAKRGNDVVGISFQKRNNDVAVERAKILGINNAKFITANLRELEHMSDDLGVFDQIICFETIEHIMDDKKLVKDFSNLLKPGGKLFLVAPYKHYKRRSYDKISDFEDGGHVRWGYTHKEMRELLNEFNFKVEAEEYIIGYISQQLCRLTAFLDSIYPMLGWLIVFPFRPLALLDPLLAKFINYPSLSVGVVAVKR